MPFLAYVLIRPAAGFFTNQYTAYALHVLVAVTLLAVFWKKYKLNFKFDFLAILVGAIIFLIWIGLEGFYPVLFKIEYVPINAFFLISRLIGFLLIAPVIEELFTRSFLIRFIISNNWKKVPIGKYTLPSFIITVLFFGFSHSRWLAGIIAGVLLNLLLYKQKSIESCIVAHFTANLLLAIYVITTSSWFMW